MDLYAASSKAKARSMQVGCCMRHAPGWRDQRCHAACPVLAPPAPCRSCRPQAIKQDKLARTQAYYQALADRDALPRFLRLLDLRLAAALADGAAASVAGAAAALQAAAPGLLQRPLDGGLGGGHASNAEEEAEEQGAEAGSEGAAGSADAPLFLTHIVLAEDGGMGFEPSEAEWAAALEAEIVAASLQLAGSVPPLLTLPAFECYNASLLDGGYPRSDGGAAVDEAAEQGGQPEPASSEAQGQEQPVQPAAPAAKPAGAQPEAAHRHEAAELAQQDGSFVGGAAAARALLSHSFEKACRLAERYRQYQEIRRYGQEFDFEAWEAQQRAELDLAATEAALRQLQAWQAALERMPLHHTTGLLRLDAAGLQASLAPVVASALDRIGGLLLALSGECCAALLNELRAWAEVMAARPPELDGFLAWAAELARMQEAIAGEVAAAAAADAALELVLAFVGRLPPAEAVRKDDLREAATQLPAQLCAAAEWAAAQRQAHGASVAQLAREVAEEAVLLEAELQVRWGQAGGEE